MDKFEESMYISRRKVRIKQFCEFFDFSERISEFGELGINHMTPGAVVVGHKTIQSMLAED